MTRLLPRANMHYRRTHISAGDRQRELRAGKAPEPYPRAALLNFPPDSKARAAARIIPIPYKAIFGSARGRRCAYAHSRVRFIAFRSPEKNAIRYTGTCAPIPMRRSKIVLLYTCVCVCVCVSLEDYYRASSPLIRHFLTKPRWPTRSASASSFSHTNRNKAPVRRHAWEECNCRFFGNFFM